MNATSTAVALLSAVAGAVVMHRVDVWWWRGAASRTARRLARHTMPGGTR